MSNNNVLSASDFLGLHGKRQTKLVDLAPAGVEGSVYIRSLTAGEKRKVISMGKNKQMIVRNDKSMSIPMPETADVDFCYHALCTDKTGEMAMRDAWAEEIKKTTPKLTPNMVEQNIKSRLSDMPNAVINLLVGEIRVLSGMDEDSAGDEGKES